MQGRLERIREYWSYKAETDALEASGRVVRGERFSDEVIEAICRDILGKLELSNEDRLLDAGCGSMLIFDGIKDEAGSAIGIDFSFSLLERFKGSNKVVCGELSALPFADSSFDKVLSNGVVICLPDMDYVKKATLELVRVCRPGGMILISDILNGFLERERRIDKYIVNASYYAKRPVTLVKRLFLAKMGDGDHIMIPPVFFKELAEGLGHRCNLLIQAIEGKPDCKWRYDVLIEKRK